MPTHKSITEWDFLAETQKILQLHGKVTMPFITAQFQPCSSKDRPDLVFTCLESPLSAVFVEFKLSPASLFPHDLVGILKEHSEFAQSDSELHLKFMFATPEGIPQEFKTQLSNANIAIADHIKSPAELAQQIINLFGKHE